MDVSGGNVTITKSKATRDGGSGGVGRFLGPGTGDEGCSVRGEAVLGRRVLRVQGLRGLQADAAPEQVTFVETKVCLVIPLVHFLARADLATEL